MLSRVAESIYWLNRYVERAENVARFIDVNVQLTLGGSDSSGNQWEPLISTTGDNEAFSEQYGSNPTRENVCIFLLYDPRNPNSIYSCVNQARENARTIRQIIPTVVWEQLNKFYLLTKESARKQNLEDMQDFCEEVRLSCHLLAGAADATMSKGEPWHFARLGRMLERADKTSRIVDVQYYNLLPKSDDVGSTLDVVRWSSLLKSTSALAMYRRTYGNITPQRVAEFLILDRTFPRSMHHCVLTSQKSLLTITGCPPGTFLNYAERRMGRLNSSMDYAQIEEIVADGMHEYIDGFQTQLNQIGEAITDVFFTWSPLENATNGMTQKQSQTQSMG